MNNPLIEEIHVLRAEFARKMNFDLDAMFRYWKEEERKAALNGAQFLLPQPSSAPSPALARPRQGKHGSPVVF